MGDIADEHIPEDTHWTPRMTEAMGLIDKLLEWDKKEAAAKKKKEDST